MARRGRLAKVALAGTLLLGLTVLPSSAANQVPGQPGLTDYRADPTQNHQGYIRPQTRGVNHVAAAQQWVATPNIMTASFNHGAPRQSDPTCTRIRALPGARSLATYTISIVLANADALPGATDRFGQSQAFEVQTVAFGSIPVAVTLAIEQPHDADGLVVPMSVFSLIADFCAHTDPFPTRPPNNSVDAASFGPNNGYHRTDGQGEVRVRIDQVVVDGVPVDLTGGCRSDWGVLELGSPPLYTHDPAFGPGELPLEQNHLTTKHFSISGGLMTGAIDVGPFSGCATATGDDLSGLLTSAVSGEGNRIEMRAMGTQQGPGDDGLNGCPFTTDCTPYWPRPEIPDQAPAGP